MPVLIEDLQDKVNLPSELVPLLEEVSAFVLYSEGYPHESEVSIVLVDNNYIRELNSTYRGYDSPTDVLSFCLHDEGSAEEGDNILGDVIISVEKAKEQAINFAHSLQREVAFLVVHGILHLVGYDHETTAGEKDMMAKQDLVMKHFKL